MQRGVRRAAPVAIAAVLAIRSLTACTPDDAGGGGPQDAAAGSASDSSTHDAAPSGDDASNHDAAASDASDAADGSGPVVDFTMPANGLCSLDGWCLENPTPLSNGTSFSVWGTSQTDVWVGGSGVLAHYDGAKWTGRIGLAPTTVAAAGGNRTTYGSVTAIFGSGASDAWALIDKTLWRWDGAHWKLQTFTSPFAIARGWAKSTSDAWVVGQSGTIMHWDGISWTASKSGTVDDLSDVFGFAANDVWAVGGGTVIHWDGAAWGAPAAAFPGAVARHLWGSASGDLWIQGDTAAYHWNGASFTTSTPTQVASMKRGYGVAGNGADVVFLAETSAGGTGLFSTTGLLSLVPCTYTEAQTLWGAGGTYFAAAIPPTSSFTPECPLLRVTAPQFDAPAQIMSQWSAIPQAVGGGPANDPWFWNGNKLYRGFGSTTPVAWGSTSATIETVSARAANDVWVTASGGVVSHFDGVSWSPQAPAGAADFGKVWSNATTDAWGSNGTNVHHWNGGSWTDTGSPTTGIVAVVGFGPGAAFAATTGQDGAIFAYSSGTWTRALSFPYAVSLWGTSPSNVWALDGLKGTFAHFDGKAWTTKSGGPFGVLFGSEFGSQVRWFSENDIWVVNANDDDAYHWDGAAWRVSHTGSILSNGRATIAGSSANDLWIVSGGSSVLHRGP